MSITLQVGVKIFLRNHEGKFLLLKRSSVRYPNIKNFWDIPGGRIDPGSRLVDNLTREVREETKLGIASAPKLIAAQDIIRPDKHIVRLTFYGDTSGEPTLHEEHTEYRWLSLEEMLSIPELDEFTREVIETGAMR